MTFTKIYTLLITLIISVISIKSYAIPNSSNGIWKSEKLQFYLEIKGNVFNRYQYTNLSCFNGGAGFLPSTGFVSDNKLSDYFPYFISDNQMNIKRPQESLSLNLVKIKKLPYACKGQPVDTILSNFYIFWQTINELYNFSHIEKNTWSTIFKEQLPTLIDLDMRLFESRSEEDIFLITKLEEILYQISDPHLLLIAPSVKKSVFGDSSKNKFDDIYYNRKRLDRWLDEQIKSIKGESKWLANKNIVVIEVGQILYINIIKLNSLGNSSLYDLSAIQNLKSAEKFILNKLTNHSKVIIDLRFNDGGSVDAANKLSSIFTNLEQNVTFIQIEKDTPLKVLSGNDGTGIKPLCLTVLTSHFTASAAEYLTLNLLQSGGVSIGEKTRGAFSPMILKSLPNNWILGIPPFNTYDQFEQPLPENKGITPDINKDWFFTLKQQEKLNLEEYIKHCKS
jgi:hypothetical protein